MCALYAEGIYLDYQCMKVFFMSKSLGFVILQINERVNEEGLLMWVLSRKRETYERSYELVASKRA